MKKSIKFSIFVFCLFFGCTDINENVYDSYSADKFYATPEGVNASLAGVYAQIPGNWGGVGYAGADNGWYDLNTMSSDEQVVPHRTTGDWGLEHARLYQRQWLANHSFASNTWNWLYESIYKANLAIEQLENADAEPSRIAEAKVLRAFFYYLLIDDFGNVPFYTENNLTVDEIPVQNRSTIFSFIVDELNTNIENLSETIGGEYYGRFNKWAGYALLAKLYLNAEVYTGSPMWQECISAIENLTAGGFTLHSGAEDSSHPLGSKYYELFGDVLPNDETILAIPMTAEIVGRAIFTVRSLGGTDGNLFLGSGAWNGTVIPTHYLNYFDFNSNDIRNRQFRFGDDPYGPQPEGFIVYDTEVLNLDNPGAPPNAGTRSQKFFPVPPMGGGGASNDFPIYRYADFLLMKAECLVRMGNAAIAKPYIDDVRVRAGLDPLARNPTLDDVYEERSRELTWEGHRRQDMIRFDTFTEAHGLLQPASEDYRKLFPIPTSALNANPNLAQNPGY